MKKIKVKLVGFWESCRPDELFICRILEKYYDVEYCDDADYIICSLYWGDGYYNYLDYPKIRIFYSFENYFPDFNHCDYAISPFRYQYNDRHLCYPICLDANQGHFEKLIKKDRNYNKSILDNKIYFANFICGHESENGIRGDFFKKLCKYKRVESPGSYLNNMPDNQTVVFTDNSKTDFQRKCKFSLCFESTVMKDFVTEKITDAFYSDTIPIYYGSDFVKEIFNPKAFINCADYNSFDEVIERIIELDQDDEKYLKMLSEPILVDTDYYYRKNKEAEEFIRNIFDQPIEKSVRRSLVYWPQKYESYIRWLKEFKKRIENEDIVDLFSFRVFVKLAIKRVVYSIKKMIKREDKS